MSAEAVERCVDEHERARLLRLQEQWSEARELMTRCAEERCPVAIRVDCRAWLDELTRILPTLLILLEQEGGPTAPVRFELDGETVELPESPRPIEVSPGRHHLRFVMPGFSPIEREVELLPGEKNRVVRVSFERRVEPPPADVPASPPKRSAPPPASPPAVAGPSSAPQAAADPPRPIPTVTYVFAGGALAAFVVSGSLLVSALSLKADAEESCTPACRPGTQAPIDRRLLFADIAGGVGIALGGLAVYTFLQRPDAGATGSAWLPKLTVSKNVASISYGLSF
ncbi:MAG TPA: hypothetical protein VKZ49_18715 [Polyangiaceae bacterium]|nr:hypothetical protein [Polyangiaceae bacterium]